MFHSFLNSKEKLWYYFCVLWFCDLNLEFQMKVHVFGNGRSPAAAIYGLKRTDQTVHKSKTMEVCVYRQQSSWPANLFFMANQANSAKHNLSSKHLRVVGWLTRAQLTSDESHLILIPGKHHVIKDYQKWWLFPRPVSEVILLVCVCLLCLLVYICCFWIWHLIDARPGVYWSQ